MDSNIREGYHYEYLGCTIEEIEEIAHIQDIYFMPEVYQQFMLQMGKGIKGYMIKNIEWVYPDVLHFKQHWCSEYWLKKLGHDICIFGQDRDGLGFTFFNTKIKLDNPPVYAVIEGEVKQIDDLLSGFLIAEFSV